MESGQQLLRIAETLLLGTSLGEIAAVDLVLVSLKPYYSKEREE